jgi:hypothetical protein
LSDWDIERLKQTFSLQTSMVLYSRTRRRDSGYIMLTLTLVMALMVIFAAAIVPSITFEIKRDREEEMIHRGVQYSRAIRTFYKKFGRYPTKIEDLENTNNLRFLRKRYKDPENCKNGKCADFKLLHFGEVQLSLSGAGIAGLGAAAAAAGAAGGLNSTATNALRAMAGSAAAQNQLGGTSPAPGSDPTQPGAMPGDGTSDGTPNGSSGGTSNGTGTNSTGSTSGGFGNSQITPGQIIGAPIIGVASTSKETTIREFNKKKKYKDWMFVYDPAQDLGRLITTPYQPQLQGFGSQGPQNANGLNGTSTGTGTSGFGNGLGNSSNGLQNNPTAPTAPSNPPYGAPPQQQ